jgi:hypothetical protein
VLTSTSFGLHVHNRPLYSEPLGSCQVDVDSSHGNATVRGRCAQSSPIPSNPSGCITHWAAIVAAVSSGLHTAMHSSMQEVMACESAMRVRRHLRSQTAAIAKLSTQRCTRRGRHVSWIDKMWGNKVLPDACQHALVTAEAPSSNEDGCTATAPERALYYNERWGRYYETHACG